MAAARVRAWDLWCTKWHSGSFSPTSIPITAAGVAERVLTTECNDSQCRNGSTLSSIFDRMLDGVGARLSEVWIQSKSLHLLLSSVGWQEVNVTWIRSYPTELQSYASELWSKNSRLWAASRIGIRLIYFGPGT
jgi:hypothetical protein